LLLRCEANIPLSTTAARFGALVGLYAVGAFVLHNHVNLRIGAKLTFLQAMAYFIEWTVVGMVIGLIYRSVAP